MLHSANQVALGDDAPAFANLLVPGLQTPAIGQRRGAVEIWIGAFQIHTAGVVADVGNEIVLVVGEGNLRQRGEVVELGLDGFGVLARFLNERGDDALHRRMREVPKARKLQQRHAARLGHFTHTTNFFAAAFHPAGRPIHAVVALGKGVTRPEVLWRFLQGFPDITVVCAHWGGGLPFYALMPEVGEALGNVYFDTAASPFLYEARVFQVVASLVGPGRVLLGSDFPLIRPARLIGQANGSAMSRADKEAIIGGNAARLLGA